jgi:hypothetical protein
MLCLFQVSYPSKLITDYSKSSDRFLVLIQKGFVRVKSPQKKQIMILFYFKNRLSFFPELGEKFEVG